MNEIIELYNRHINTISDYYNTNPAVPDFIEKCIRYDKNFLEDLKKIKPTDSNGIYAKQLIISYFTENEVKDPKVKVEEFRKVYGDSRIQDDKAASLMNKIFENIKNFKSLLEQTKNISPEEAEKRMKYDNQNQKGKEAIIPFGMNLKLDNVSISSDYCNSPVFNLSNSPSRTLG